VTVEHEDVDSRSADRTDAVLDSYHARLRRWRIAYVAALAALVLVIGGIVAIAYRHGEISHTALTTVASAPPSAALREPVATLTQAWRTDDRSAIGMPSWGGTVITYSEHSVRGRDARTGHVTWSYTRDDRVLCQVAQTQGTTIAAFEVNGNCDELTALDSATGTRKWTRTLDKDGHELNGRPSYLVTPYTLMMTTPSVIYAVDPAGGLDRWVFAQQGCTIRDAVLGSAGALISQSCAKPVCGEQKFCGAGEQLLLRDANAGENTDTASNKGNPDQIKWNLIGNTMRPVSADSVVSAVEPGSDRLTVLDAAGGTVQARVPLDAPATGTPTAIETARTELLWIGGVTYAVAGTGSDLLWHATTPGPPTVTSANGSSPPDLSAARILVKTPTSVAALDPETGAVAHSYAVAAGGLAYPYGSGFLVSGAGTVMYR
jgi:hypothetical protein